MDKPKEKIIKLCDYIFSREIKKAKLELKQFETGLYQRELYWYAIKSFKKGFMKQLKQKLKLI